MFQYLIKLLTLIYFALIMYIMLYYIDIESYLLFGNYDYLFRSIKQIVLATVATNKLWAYIKSLVLSKSDRIWLAGKLL